MAMQIAAYSPKYVSKDQVPEGTEGKIDEIVLLEQDFAFDDDKKQVKEAIQEKSTQLGTPIRIREFIRYSLGESK